MRTEEWLELIEEYKEYMKMCGYSDNTIKYEITALRRILREFGDIDKVTEDDIQRKYWFKSKYTRRNTMQALRNFKRWLRVVRKHGQD